MSKVRRDIFGFYMDHFFLGVPLEIWSGQFFKLQEKLDLTKASYTVFVTMEQYTDSLN